jgi:hypothetical protein
VASSGGQAGKPLRSGISVALLTISASTSNDLIYGYGRIGII